ncbi:Tip elongation aberrant protein 1 [Tetrabaena socialis]|uniref:Tip elongation aberrant protein 1 n=1 Tax=Tetrabaena socialis TaxID=47790 RepID=A0A2J8AK23_9CHLO|nr:Tip elongation aberrant protein 1 [Tetrabaena socialis]|eukprot:PNH12850.1 Tip elongation aberrant protein 1 [Tetrabaena socialis]
MGGQWQLVKTDGLAPAPRGAHACVALGTRVLVFGGADRAPITLNDLWVLETGGCKLLPRSGATLTAIGDLVYLFGGTEPVSGLCFNELKVLDTNTWTWSDVQTEGSQPPPRHSHCSGCLADVCLIVYGGAGYQGPLQDVWIYNSLQNSWNRPVVSGEQPAAREMHTGCMIDSTTLLVYGGRGAEFKVLCDAALFDARLMKWTAIEPTPFSRCAHSSVVLPAPRPDAQPVAGTATAAAGGEAGISGAGEQPQQLDGSRAAGGEEPASSSGGGGGACRVLMYGGYSGEAVEGDILQIDGQTLEIELVRRGPRESDKGGTVPPVRFAHSAALVPAPGGPEGAYAMVVFGGVNPREDMNDVAVWVQG